MKSTKRRPFFERLREGLEEGIQHARGEITLKTTVLTLPDPPPDVRAEELTRLRQDNRMSEADFARLLNVSTRTVRSWEKGTSKPARTALRLIQVLRHDPGSVLRSAGLESPATRPRG